jgi:hypothetical protein
MSKLLLPIIFIFACGLTSLAQPRDTTILLPNRLVITSIKRAQPKITIDTAGLVSIVCLNQSDTAVLQKYRQLSGRMIGYTDSSIVLHVDTETIQTYYRNGKVGNFYYSKEEDSLHYHVDTIQFGQIHTISYDTGRFRKVRGILQSTAYLYITGNIIVLVTAAILPKASSSLVPAKNMLHMTGIAFAAGGASMLFYPKVYRLANQPKRRHRIRWRIEVR